MEDSCGCGCSDNLPSKSRIGDHDAPFAWGNRPTVADPFPFTTRQYGRLLVMRSRIQDSKTLVVVS